MTGNLLYVVAGLLVISFISSLYLIWIIVFRLRSHLISISYKFILAAKVCFLLLTGSGVYLIIWPLANRVVAVQLSWFSILAIGTTCSAIGFALYARDVHAVLDSEGYTEHLPANPSTEIYKSEPPIGKEV